MLLGKVNIKSRQVYSHIRFLVLLFLCIIILYFFNVANALETELYDKFKCSAVIGILVTGDTLRYSYTLQKLFIFGTLALNFLQTVLLFHEIF